MNHSYDLNNSQEKNNHQEPDSENCEINSISSVDISKAIMQKIKCSGVKMKSRWLFYTQKLGLRSGFVLSILLTAFLINIFLFILKRSGALEFLDFGVSGLNIVLTNIPYDLTLLILVFAVLANLVIKTFDFEHRKYFYILSVLSVAVSCLCGLAIFSTGINDAIAKKVSQQKQIIPVVNKFYNQDRLQLSDDNSFIGQVIEYKVINEPFIVITKNGEMLTVHCQNCLPNISGIDIGQVIKAIGQRQQEFFEAQQIKLLSNNQIFMPISGPMQQVQVEFGR